MDKIKVKVIGVLRERGGAVNVNHKHNLIGPNVVNNLPQENGHIVEDESFALLAGGAARTSILARPQISKMSELEIAGIMNTRRRLEWTKEWLRKNQAEFLSKENLRNEIQYRNNECYHLNYFLTVTESQFRFLVQKMEPEISQYAPQRKKKSFSAEERLAITLKYLATGEVHSCRNYCFRASKLVIFKMIANICHSFYTLLKDQYLQLPKTDEQWQQLANDMQRKHGLSKCLGTVFMREIQFHSTIYNEESKQAPLILTGIVDSNNNFLYINVEFTQAKAYSEIYESSAFKKMIEQSDIAKPIVKPTDLKNNLQEEQTNYYFVGDDTMPSKPYLISTQNVKQNSDSQKVLENVNTHTEHSLRILSNMFPILAQAVRVNAQHIRDIVLGCVALYNFLRKSDETFHQRSDNIVKQPWGLVNTQADNDDSDDDCIMLASEEELRERAEFTPSIGLTTCFHNLCAQKGRTNEGLVKLDWLAKSLSGQTQDFC